MKSKKRNVPPGGFANISCNISTRKVWGVSWIGAAAGIGTGGGSGCGWYAEMAGSRLRWKAKQDQLFNKNIP
jgi:hypothetical protein